MSDGSLFWVGILVALYFTAGIVWICAYTYRSTSDDRGLWCFLMFCGILLWFIYPAVEIAVRP